MSIPKEPRQLMINLMYLVLTALLALNVSAEIINAFFALKKGITSSNVIVDGSNQQVMKQINKQADAYKNVNNEAYRSASMQVQEVSKEFSAYIEEVNSKLIEAAGGRDEHYTDGRPKRYKDKDVTTNMFITEKKGDEMEAKINDSRDKLLALIKEPKDREEIATKIALKVDSIAQDSKAKTWSEYKFKQMPVAAIMPFFSKLQADMKTSETAVLNYFFNKIGGTDIKFDNFKVAIAPKKGYVIKGEKFEADVYLAAYSSNPGSGVSISVNGSGLGVKDGVAHYESTSSELGKKTVKASASIKNPLTGEVKTVTGDFEYEVGERSVAVSADKMNVFYLGVENPVTVSAAGIASSELKVSATGCDIRRVNGPNYVVTATRAGEAVISVTGGGMSDTKKFRVLRIPTPVPKLGGRLLAGNIGASEFKAQEGMIAVLDETFVFDAKCQIQGFKMTKQAKGSIDISGEMVNAGGRYSGQISALASNAKAGDKYYFDDIKALCPGDQGGRNLGGMFFNIK